MGQVIILALILFLSLSPSALTDTGGYTVEKHAPQDGLIDSSGADGTVTFWDLPLWIKMAYVSGIIFAFLGSLKIFPMILGGSREYSGLMRLKIRIGLEFTILSKKTQASILESLFHS